MKRFSVVFNDGSFQYVWSESKRNARKQMALYSAYTGKKIVKVI